MSDSGGVASGIVSELKGVVTQATKEVVGLSTDVVKDSIETVATGGTSSPQSGSPKEAGTSEQGGVSTSDPLVQKKQQNKILDKRRFEQVKAELEQYRQERAREQRQVVVEEEERKKQLVQFEEKKKDQERKALIQNNAKQYGGTGEVAKKKG